MLVAAFITSISICDTGVPKCRTYRGHLLGEDYRRHKEIPQGEALVLFHYMTRSFQDFRERKLSRCASVVSLLRPLNALLLIYNAEASLLLLACERTAAIEVHVIKTEACMQVCGDVCG